MFSIINRIAFKNTKVYEYRYILENLGYIILGDAAYPQIKSVCIPISGSNNLDFEKNQYNFFLSQLRIRIEMVSSYLLKYLIFK